MNNEFNRKCFQKALYCFGVIALSILFFHVIRDLSGFAAAIKAFFGVFDTILTALVFAYILHPLILFFRKRFSKLFKKPKKVLVLSIFVTYFIVLLFLGVFIWQLVPALISNITYFASNFASYLRSFRQFASDVSGDIYFGREIFDAINDTLVVIAQTVTDWFSGNFLELVDVLFKTTDIIIGFVVSFIISVYMSYSRDTLLSQLKKVMIAVFPRKVCDKIMYAAYVVNDCFSSYMSGVFLSALIIGLLCLICMSIFGLEYAPLISFIVMLTDIIPYFGPFIGAGLGAVLLVLVNPWHALWFLIIVFVLQQLTSNIINPGIIGKATGLDSIYVIISIIVMGGFFGVVGMIIGVPIFVIILRIIRKFISSRTKENSNEKSAEQ